MVKLGLFPVHFDMPVVDVVLVRFLWELHWRDFMGAASDIPRRRDLTASPQHYF